MLNNLFHYATSELSQDAFICWLLSFAHKDSEGKDSTLRDCAVQLIQEFVPVLKGMDKSQIVVTSLMRQHEHIDVFVVVNEMYGIIIEDKTHYREHNDQLARYEERIRELYPELILNKIYYKTGFQSDYAEVKNKGYTIFDRKQIVNFFQPYIAKIKNDIFIDYFNSINYLEINAVAFRDISVADWNWMQVNGFYDNLINSSFFDELGYRANFGYVPNRSGGFDGMWIKNEKYYEFNGVKYELYVQMEFIDRKMKICLKVQCPNIKEGEKGVEPSELRNYLIWYKDEAGTTIQRAEKYNFDEPSRFGSGKTMTIGIYNKKSETAEKIEINLREALKQFEAFTSEI